MTRVADFFWLDAGRLAAYVISNEEELFGFDSSDERGFAAAIASRFDDAHEAGAIDGPRDLEVIVYALVAESLIVAVRERELPRPLPPWISAKPLTLRPEERFLDRLTALEPHPPSGADWAR